MIQHIKQVMVCRPQQFVFYEGHPVLAVYVLCEGRLKLTRSSIKGQQRVVKIVEPGQIVEWHIYQDSPTHHATAETLEASRICVIDRVSFLNLLERDGQLAIHMLKLMSQERVAALSCEDRLAFSSARERIAALLDNLATRYGTLTKDGVEITLLLKREDLAQMASLTIETTVRVLKELEANQVIRLLGRTITIRQRERLQGEMRAVC